MTTYFLNNSHGFVQGPKSSLKFRRRAKKRLAVNFGRDSVEIMYVKLSSEKSTVLAYAIKNLSEDHKNDYPAIEIFIKKFVKKHASSAKEIIISFSDHGQVETKRIVFPPLPSEEILGMIQWQLKEDISFDLDQALIDWQTLSEFKDANGEQKVEMNVVIVPKEAVESYVEIVERCGLLPIGMTNENYNLTEFISYTTQLPDVAAILDIGEDYSTINVIYQGKVCFVRKIAITSNMFVQALTRTVVTEKGEMQLSSTEASAMVDEVGIPIGEEGKSDGEKAHIMSLLRPVLESLIREIKFSIHYFKINFKQLDPEIFYVLERNKYVKNLDHYLSQQMDLAVDQIALSDRFDFSRLESPPTKEQSFALINILGAAIGGCQSINLIRRSVDASRTKRMKDRIFQYSVILFGLILLFFIANTQIEVRSFERTLKERQAYLRQIKPIEEVHQRVALKEGLRHHIQSGKIPVAHFLYFISDAIPDEVVLSEVNLSVLQGQLLLKGYVFSERPADSAVTSFMQKLEEFKSIQEVSLATSKKVESRQLFEIICDLGHHEKE